MTSHATGTRNDWLVARVDLLAAEKELTRQSDALAERRQALPWVRIDKTYQFDTDNGRKSLAQLFNGRSQLLVYHFSSVPITRRDAHPARRSPTGSTASRCIWKITT